MNQGRTEARFFVYGSLTQGLVHFKKIRDFVLSCQPAQIQASAFRLKVGYPVLVEGGQDSVQGELICIRAPDLLIQLLDQFHGYLQDHFEKCLYWRKEVTVQTAEGLVSAWAYFLNPKHLPKNAKVIEQGDWKKSMTSEPALTEKLTDRQKAYIMKLGQTTGREIVPIDLALYRELMNLEIIVDKGRRLALSKLGHEVYRYLS